MDSVIIGLLLFVILCLAGLLAFIVQKGIEERQIFFNQIRDLTDKLYFTKANDFISNKVLEDKPKEEAPVKKEEEEIPLENVPIEDLVEAYGGKVK